MSRSCISRFTIDNGGSGQKNDITSSRNFGPGRQRNIEAGKTADLVLFDPDGLLDKATYEDPYQLGDGIKWVMINGDEVIKERIMTSSYAGKLLVRQ